MFGNRTRSTLQWHLDPLLEEADQGVGRDQEKPHRNGVALPDALRSGKGRTSCLTYLAVGTTIAVKRPYGPNPFTVEPPFSSDSRTINASTKTGRRS